MVYLTVLRKQVSRSVFVSCDEVQFIKSSDFEFVIIKIKILMSQSQSQSSDTLVTVEVSYDNQELSEELESSHTTQVIFDPPKFPKRKFVRNVTMFESKKKKLDSGPRKSIGYEGPITTVKKRDRKQESTDKKKNLKEKALTAAYEFMRPSIVKQ